VEVHEVWLGVGAEAKDPNRLLSLPDGEPLHRSIHSWRKAVAAARQSKLPKCIMDAIEEARAYAEGRGFYVKVSKPNDLAHLKSLVSIKFETK
jgi:hypothetical protein